MDISKLHHFKSFEKGLLRGFVGIKLNPSDIQLLKAKKAVELFKRIFRSSHLLKGKTPEFRPFGSGSQDACQARIYSRLFT